MKEQDLHMQVKTAIHEAILSLPVEAQLAFEDALSFGDLIQQESDRACALMAAAYIDEKLKDLLLAKLVPCKELNKLLDVNQPLGAFGVRAQLCFITALITRETYADINIIRAIRNDFAHSAKSLTFETHDIKSKCFQLTCDLSPPNVSARQKFNNSSLSIVGRLVRTAVSIPKLVQLEDEPIPIVGALKSWMTDHGVD